MADADIRVLPAVSNSRGRLSLAIVDDFGNPVVVWDDTRLAKELVAARLVQQTKPTRLGRWPFRRNGTREPALEDACKRVLHELSMEVTKL